MRLGGWRMGGGLARRSALRCGDMGLPLGRLGARRLLSGTWTPRGRVPAGEGIGLRHRRHPHVDAVADDGPTGILGVAGAKARDRDVASERDDAWIDGARARVHVGARGGVAAQYVAGHEELCCGRRGRGNLSERGVRDQANRGRQTDDPCRHTFSFPLYAMLRRTGVTGWGTSCTSSSTRNRPVAAHAMHVA